MSELNINEDNQDINVSIENENDINVAQSDDVTDVSIQESPQDVSVSIEGDTDVSVETGEQVSNPDYVRRDGTIALTADWDAGSFSITAEQFISDVATGTSPFVVSSVTKVSNLNADLLDDQTGSYYLDRANHTGLQLSSTISDFSEAVDDRVSALLQAGSNILISYDDPSGTITISGSAGYTDEQARDAIGTALIEGTGIDIAVNDVADTITIASTITQYTDALARAAISETITGIDYNSITGIFSLTTGYVIPTTTEELNWNTAYGWGNHATAGYLTSVTAHNLLSATHGDTTAGSAVAGDIIYADATPKWTKLAKGIDGKVLTLVSGLPSWETPAVGYTDEQARDTIALMIQNGTGISWVYNDPANTLTPTITLSPFTTSDLAEGTNFYFTDERVDDRVASLIQNGTGITWLYNDIANTFTPTVTITQYTDELAQDAIGMILIDSDTIDLTYNDGTPSIMADIVIGNTKQPKVKDSGGVARSFMMMADTFDLITPSAGDNLFIGNPLGNKGLTLFAGGSTSTYVFLSFDGSRNLDISNINSLKIYNSATPTISSAGQIGVNTSVYPDSHFRFFGDASYALSPVYSRSFIITNPTANSDNSLWRAPYAITIKAVHLLCKGNVVVGHLTEQDANGLNDAGVDGVTDITGVVDTNVNDDGTLSNPSIDAGDYVGWRTTSVTGTPTYAIITIEYVIT